RTAPSGFATGAGGGSRRAPGTRWSSRRQASLWNPRRWTVADSLLGLLPPDAEKRLREVVERLNGPPEESDAEYLRLAVEGVLDEGADPDARGVVGPLLLLLIDRE